MAELPLGTVPQEVGWLPDTMKAAVIRPDREGEPVDAMRIEDVPVPDIGPLEALVLVMAAGVNFNGVWAARGEPVSVMRFTGDDFHIAGSDAAGIVWKVGSEVRGWKPGDEVVLHANQRCGQCPACNGLDPMACDQQKIWGYESNWGSFAQFAKVQSQQLLPKPPHLSWEDAASYGLTLFTAYRMLVDQARIGPGDNVLVWGAAGGLGIFATQLCALMGANAIGVVSSDAKAELVRGLGAKGVVNRSGYGFAKTSNETPEQQAARTKEMRRFGGAVREATGGADPDVVFEHVGQETFPTSVFLAKKFGKIVICGATSGYDLEFDVRYLWTRQKRIIGSHLANAYESARANELVMQQKIRPVVGGVFPLEEAGKAHQLMHENKHQGKLVIRVQAPRQ